ncbi:MAG: adenine deaminase [Methanoregula sp.]
MPDVWLRELLEAARGQTPADAVFRNARIFNPFICNWEPGTLAVKDGLVLGIGNYAGRTEYDLRGSYIVPGLIDAHVHIESSLLAPREYARVVVRHGTTTVVADPHEIANVAGTRGIDFMLSQRNGAVIDILYLLPSCVPSTPEDVGGAILKAGDLRQYTGRDGICGLGEMMDVPGVLAADPSVLEKLRLCSVRDGHAPLLTGNDLNAYILAGLQSDHECTRLDEAEEKLRRGMYIFLREGSTERNIAGLIDLVTPDTVSRCCFATDDCHADILSESGHIDRCIRRAVQCGLKPELALRMATLSAAERFGLSDRGALTPGRRADFCIIDDPRSFRVKNVFVLGNEIAGTVQVKPPPFFSPFPGRALSADEIHLDGCGEARVIGLVPLQILTTSLRYTVKAQDIPDFGRDILKIVICDRYREAPCCVGLVHGFSLKGGAIASSISHDAHNVVAVGAGDEEILSAMNEVIRLRGAMVAVAGRSKTVLPLDCGGLMSTLPYPDVVARLHDLHDATEKMGSISDPFMYLSFLALTVIPELRMTTRGMFEVRESRSIPLFVE